MYKRVVVKVGTKMLSRENGHIDELMVASLVRQIASIRKSGAEVVLVTSGAVGSGRGIMKPPANKTETIADKQVFAAIGQVKLMEIYSKLFEKEGYLCAQVLVTKEDFRDRGHYQNMHRCFLNLLRDGVMPIVNENDVVAIKELVFTDNDELAGLVAAELEADAVIILTSVDGVLNGNPSDPSSKTIPQIDSKSIASIQKNIGQGKTGVGRGGMLTKLSVAKKLISSGIAVHIAHGKGEHVLEDILKGKPVGTKFVPARKTSGVKRRLAYSEGLTMGVLVVNECTSDMLVARDRVMSLLPVGITKVEGDFHKGDVIEIRDMRHKKLGFGISAYDSDKVKPMLGQKGGKPVVHYDYMFIE